MGARDFIAGMLHAAEILLVVAVQAGDVEEVAETLHLRTVESLSDRRYINDLNLMGRDRAIRTLGEMLRGRRMVGDVSQLSERVVQADGPELGSCTID